MVTFSRWRTNPAPGALCVCSSLPPGSSVQHLFHHRPRRLRPRLALPCGGRSDVHFGIRRVHWSAAGKHFPPQVCKYPTLPSGENQACPQQLDAAFSERELSRKHWQNYSLGHASLYESPLVRPCQASLIVYVPPHPMASTGVLHTYVTTAFQSLKHL